MNFQLASRLENIAPFHVMELAKMAAELEAQGRSIIHMGIGEPNFTAPQVVVDAAAQAMAQGDMRYTSALGLPALREAISTFYAQRFGVTVPASRIVVTAGASAALLLACAALVESGAEVLMPDPTYPCNRHFVAAFEGVARLIETNADSRFQLTAEMVESHWQSQTAGVVLASPSNPTGTSIPAQTLSEIIGLVVNKGGFTIVDEIYQGLTYDTAPFTALSLSQDVIVINSFSKYLAVSTTKCGKGNFVVEVYSSYGTPHAE
jgi:aspartate/methionine/tyrosine aminotransferase